MPKITIDGKNFEFDQGETILQVALRNQKEIPHYCYHPGLSVVASCRICLAEVWAPNPRNENKLEPIPKVLPTCQTPAGDGQVVYTDSPKAVQAQKGVMEYLLINHPLDCPVCDQAGECSLQDYSYQYGRGVSRFEEDKIKQPKKDLGPNVLLYSDRCIMCSRCVRFTREVSGTAELTIDGRGAFEQIDVFPGHALDNELASNVIDLCPVGALLDKDFLFAQRVWFLKSTPSIDGVTSSGDSIWLEHNEGKVYRIRPRENLAINRWWISDEVRYGWQFIHGEGRMDSAWRRQHGALIRTDTQRALHEAADLLSEEKGKKAIVVSPMLTSEDAYCLGLLAQRLGAEVAMGPVPIEGEDRVYPKGEKPASEGGKGYVVRAEKCPNSRGVRRVLEGMGIKAMLFEDFERRAGEFALTVITAGYPSDWTTKALRDRFDRAKGDRARLILLDLLTTDLLDSADVALPGSSWAEKAGTFENATGVLQAFDRAIAPVEPSMPEGRVALELLAILDGEERAMRYDAPALRKQMADRFAPLRAFVEDVVTAKGAAKVESDMVAVEL